MPCLLSVASACATRGAGVATRVDIVGTADNVHLSKRCISLKGKGKYTDKLPRLFDGSERYGMGVAGRVFELKTGLDGARAQKGGGCRSQVVDFTRASSRRLCRMTSMVEWDVLGSKALVTLTYPADLAPRDGRAAKRHLRNFRSRWRRRWGTPVTEVWKMEFQENGSPHFHLMIPWSGDLRELRAWCSLKWWEVCGKLSIEHYNSGTNVKFVHSDCSGYLSDINAKKGHQNQKPLFFVNPGRYWNVCGERPKMHGVLLSEAEYHTVRRVVAAWRRSQVSPSDPRILSIRKPNGRRARRKVPPIGGRAGGRLSGRWYIAPGPGRDVVAQLCRVLERDVLLLIS